ncbi:MAG: DsbA family protein, partial [Blastocatellia bacterium]
ALCAGTLALLAVALAPLVSTTQAQQAKHNSPTNSVSPSQTIEKNPANDTRQEIESIIRDYLLKNPSIIREAMQALEAKEAAAAAEAKRKALAENREALLQGASGTTLGNPKGDVTMVVFLDYRCGYCKRLEPVLRALMKQDPGVRIVMKDVPILGPESVLAARVALAARAKGQYADFFHAFLTAEELNTKSIDAIAARFGWTDASAKVAENKEVDQLLEDNYALANRLSLSGTPAIVIGDRLLEGAANLETLLALVTSERAKGLAQNLPQKEK